MLQATMHNTADNVVPLADSESMLIRQAQDGQQTAFRKLYDIYLPIVYALSLRLTSSRPMAEEATQEVFIQLWRKIGSFRGDSSFSTWLHRLSINTTISYLRTQKSWLQRVSGGDTYDSAVLALEDQASTDTSDLMHWLPKLPERARLVFVLHGIEGYRQEQVAKAMGISIGTVKAQYHKASSLLRKWLTEDPGDQP